MTLVIAHRGSGPTGPEPENTIAAFRAAARLGADGVELDIRRSADHHLVVHHDAVLSTGGLVCETPARELPTAIPSLGEALDACTGLRVNLEVKNSGGEADFDPAQWVAVQTGRLLLERGAKSWDSREGVVVSSFALEALRAVKATAPAVETAWIVGPEMAAVDLVATALGEGLQGVHPFFWLVGADLVRRAHLSGLAVRPWTVNTAEKVGELDRLGVDAVITNEVVAARRALGRTRLANRGGGREQSGT
ncbi:MAG: glycerophosphodiester phosphodiesterase [Acidimicrobiales bacterium]